jgi:hypothetical protein
MLHSIILYTNRALSQSFEHDVAALVSINLKNAQLGCIEALKLKALTSSLLEGCFLVVARSGNRLACGSDRLEPSQPRQTVFTINLP